MRHDILALNFSSTQVYYLELQPHNARRLPLKLPLYVDLPIIFEKLRRLLQEALSIRYLFSRRGLLHLFNKRRHHMVKRMAFWLAAVLLLFVMSGMAEAAMYSEDFEDFSSWESGWLGVNTNIQNYYGVGTRGNNPDGLWISDGSSNGKAQYTIEINFDPAFGKSITAFSIDITTWAKSALFELFDMDNNPIFSSFISSFGGALNDPGSYQTISLDSLNGLFGFKITSDRKNDLPVEGNTSIDNVFIATGASAAGASAVPEPNSFLLFSIAIAGLVGAGLKKKKNQQ